MTPTSQIVGTQAVMNVITGERYKMVPKESKGVLKGEYGKVPGVINEDVRKKMSLNRRIETHHNLPPRRPAGARV